MAPVSNPDEIAHCEVVLCEHCQENLSDTPALNIEKRQVTDIPPIKVYTTEYSGDGRLLVKLPIAAAGADNPNRIIYACFIEKWRENRDRHS